MRIDEIASAEDQIALFKLITDKVWQALGDQQRAEVDAKDKQPLKTKLKTQASARQSAPPRSPPKVATLKQPPRSPTQRQQMMNRPQTVQPQSSSNSQKNSQPSRIPSSGSKDAISTADVAV